MEHVFRGHDLLPLGLEMRIFFPIRFWNGNAGNRIALGVGLLLSLESFTHDHTSLKSGERRLLGLSFAFHVFCRMTEQRGTSSSRRRWSKCHGIGMRFPAVHF